MVSLLPISVLLIGLNFVNGIGWLRNSTTLFQTLRLMGVVMIVTGGIWGGFQKNLARMLGYGVIIETGFSLLAIGLYSTEGLQLFAAGILPRLLAIIVFTMGLAVLVNHGVDTDLDSIHGLLWRKPIASIAILTAYFSIGSLPILAGLPIHLEIMEQLAVYPLGMTIWTVVGILAYLIGGIRILSMIARPVEGAGMVFEETWPQRIYLSVGVVGLFLMGIFPAQLNHGIMGILKIVPLIVPTVH